MMNEAHTAEARYKGAMVDAAGMADELRNEQDSGLGYEKMRKVLECQVKEMQSKLDDSEGSTLKTGKKAMHKMDSRIRELYSELDSEERRLADAQANLHKSERHVKEIVYASDEDKRNKTRMNRLIGDLEGQVKSYSKQIEEAEEIAALNLTKYRNVQTALANSQERADLGEHAAAKTRVKVRGSSIKLVSNTTFHLL